MFKEFLRHCMGPQHCSSIAVRTGIQPGSRPWTARQVRVPLSQLSRSMQFAHQIGVSIEAVGFDYGNESSTTKQSSATTSSSKTSAAKTATPRTKAVSEPPAQEETSKPRRRSARRKR